MNAEFRQYNQLVETLREMRREGIPEPELRPILHELEDLFERLSEDEQEVANDEGWRGWPDLFDARMERLVEIDPEDPAAQASPARKAA